MFNPFGLATETFCYPELCSGLFTVNPLRVTQFKYLIGTMRDIQALPIALAFRPGCNGK